MFGCVTYEDDDDAVSICRGHAQPPRHTGTLWKPLLVRTHSILTGCRGSGYPRWSPEGCSVTQNTIVSKLWPLPDCPPTPKSGETQGLHLCIVFFFSREDRRYYALAETVQRKKRQKAIKNEDNQLSASCFALPSHWQSRQELTKSNRIIKSRRGQTGGRKCDVAVEGQPLGSVNATVRDATVRNGETADPQNNCGRHMKWKTHPPCWRPPFRPTQLLCRSLSRSHSGLCWRGDKRQMTVQQDPCLWLVVDD